MVSIAVRIPRDAHAKLQDIAEEQHTTVGNVIADWVKQHERDQYWLELKAKVAATMDDEAAWTEEVTEQRIFESALGDDWDEE